MIFANLVALLITWTPSPSSDAAALPEIGRVRSTHVCTVLHARIAPALGNMIDADRSIESGKRIFLDMGHKEVEHLRAALQLDHVRVENQVGAIVKALANIDGLMSSPVDFPDVPQTEDARTADDLKTKLQAIASAQQVAINVLHGTIETERLGEMQTEGLHSLDGVVGPESVPQVVAEERMSYLDVAGLPAGPDLIVDPRKVEASSLAAATVYGKLAVAIYDQQTHISYLESVLGASVVALAKGCPSEDGGTRRQGRTP